jgi:hypothetical protein
MTPGVYDAIEGDHRTEELPASGLLERAGGV